MTPEGNQAYLNIKKNSYSWNKPKNFEESVYITIDDIRVSSSINFACY